MDTMLYNDDTVVDIGAVYEDYSTFHLISSAENGASQDTQICVCLNLADCSLGVIQRFVTSFISFLVFTEC